MKDARGRLGLILVVVVIGCAAIGPYLSPYTPDQPDFLATLAPPSVVHPLGTDDLGRDVLSRILSGARVSLMVAIGSVVAAMAIGTPIGVISAEAGGWTDRVLMRLMDVLLAFPGILLALGITAALGASASHAALAIAMINLPVFARIARAQTQLVVAMEYIQSARAVGVSRWSILVRHIVPNAMSPVLVQASLLLASSIITESYLSFLGLGVQPPTATWGNMLRDAVGFLDQAAWLAWFPGFAIFLTVLGFNLLGDGLRDQLDVKLSH
jgi:peptide/nickel transport system permease protein